MARWALVVGGIAIAAPARAGSCDAEALAGAAGGAELHPVERVARAAAAFEEACRGYGPALEAAGDVSVVSPERRRALDFALGAKDDLWRELCPTGAKALRDAARVSPREGRALLWDECGLDGQLVGVTRDEWVERIDGMLILPLEAAVILREAGVDDEVAAGVVRGLVGLPADAAPAVADGGAEPPQPEPAPPDEGLASLDDVLGDTGPVPVPVPEPEPVPVPVPVPDPAPAPEPVPEPVPEPDPVPPDVTVGVPAVGGAKPAKPPVKPPAKRPLPPPPLVRAKFKDGGQARAKWSDEARAAGGTCVVRLRIGANGKLQRVTFLECADALKADVQVAAEKSKYLPANDGEYPVVGAFRTKWTVEPE